eukprot:4904427-Heterocapsa_arctica.AAC.1
MMNEGLDIDDGGEVERLGLASQVRTRRRSTLTRRRSTPPGPQRPGLVRHGPAAWVRSSACWCEEGDGLRTPQSAQQPG